ncbi:MAG: transketolase [Desulfuromonadales bacterium]|nr:transketolase [Desulfuromonadales bacterium]
MVHDRNTGEKSEATYDKLKETARELRVDIIKMLHASGSGHTGGSLSAIDIITVLYFYKMRHNPSNPKWPERDRFILSKGHAAPALYVALAETGYFPKEDLMTLRQLGSHLQGHPDSKGTPGVEVCTGSLGQGLSMANGIALGLRLAESDSRVYALLGDGELQEGQVWEAAMAGGHYKLDNLCIFIDSNGLQIDGEVSKIINVEPIKEKFLAFGWNVLEIDGNNVEEIIGALDKAETIKGKPTAVVAHTVKGKGVSFFENKASYHGVTPSDEEFPRALECLGEVCEFKKPVVAETSNVSKPATNNMVATRDAYGEALAELGSENESVVVLDADLSGSTKTAVFGKKFPDRFFNMGIAEANMIGTAAGFAADGKIPFASTFAIFATGRAWEQVRQSVAYPKANVKVVATHSGVTVGEDGGSHQSVEDIAIMRAVPNMTVIVPADGTETKKAIKAVAAYNGPVYVRLGRSKVPTIFGDDYSFAIGKGVQLRDGNSLTFVTTGLMTAHALTAADMLEKKGISARVVHIATVKPLDNELIIRAAKETGAIITAEEHSVIGGLGGAVAELLAEHCPVPLKRVGIYDRFGLSGKSEELLKYFKLMPEDLVEAADELMLKK